MAERKFDYENISTIYNEMKKITGSAGDTDSIAGILDKIDKDVHESVGVEDESIFGDLGSQLLLDWENSSSNFGGFVDNFNNWSTLIAQSAGKYSEFENKVKGLKNANPLGMTSGGITDAYTNTGFYSNSYTSDEIADLESNAVFYDLTGATYIDTGMVDFAKKNKIYRTVTVTLDVIGIGVAFKGFYNVAKSIAPIVKSVLSSSKDVATGAADLSALRMVSKSSGGFAAKNLSRAVSGNSSIFNGAIKTTQNAALTTKWYGSFATNFTSNFVKGTVGSSNFWNSVKTGAQGSLVASGAAASSGFLSNLAYWLGSDYDVNKYGSGYEGASISTGQTFTIDNQEYVFMGSTGSGTNVFADENNKIYYLDSNNKMNPAVIVNSNGEEVEATYDNTMTDAFTMKLGNEVVTEKDSLSSGVNYDLKEYNDKLNSFESTFDNLENNQEPNS